MSGCLNKLSGFAIAIARIVTVIATGVGTGSVAIVHTHCTPAGVRIAAVGAIRLTSANTVRAAGATTRPGASSATACRTGGVTSARTFLSTSATALLRLGLTGVGTGGRTLSCAVIGATAATARRALLGTRFATAALARVIASAALIRRLCTARCAGVVAPGTARAGAIDGTIGGTRLTAIRASAYVVIIAPAARGEQLRADGQCTNNGQHPLCCALKEIPS